jgi:hypothetical protein
MFVLTYETEPYLQLYPWLWQALHYFIQQLTDPVTFPVQLLQNTGKNKGKNTT